MLGSSLVIILITATARACRVHSLLGRLLLVAGVVLVLLPASLFLVQATKKHINVSNTTTFSSLHFGSFDDDHEEVTDRKREPSWDYTTHQPWRTDRITKEENEYSHTSSPTSSAEDEDQPTIRKHAAEMGEDAARVLNVHLVPHTHDDVGWLKTVDQYYQGWNQSLQAVYAVKSILSTAIDSLLKDPARTFTYVEQKFFTMWYDEQPIVVRDNVRFLVQNRQLIFVNGGWCMHDEATTHFIGMIDQTTLGHSFLKNEFGVAPTIGWQLDPFGHSSTQASLLSARVGFDALYFGRIDRQDLTLRIGTQQCEGLWNASRSLHGSTTIFWGLTGSYSGNYGPPRDMCFDFYNNCGYQPLVGQDEATVQQRIEGMLRELSVQAKQTQGNHIMVNMGGDFSYGQAESWYANIDIVINFVMNKTAHFDIPSLFGFDYDRVNLFYSDPEYYTKMKYDELNMNRRHHNHQRLQSATDQQPINYSIKTDDFFPYSDNVNGYWTGYFTSRTSFKRLERVASNVLMAARQINVHSASVGQATCTGLNSLEDASAVVQHHDGVSGTAKQHVYDDYSQRIQTGLDAAEQAMINQLRAIMLLDPQVGLENMRYCQLLNETICDVTEEATKSNDTSLYVVVYNPLSSIRSSIVRIPVSTNSTYRIELVSTTNERHSHAQIVFPTVAVPLPTCTEPPIDTMKFVIMFDTGPMPPMGAKAFVISAAEGIWKQSNPVTVGDGTEDTMNGEVKASNGLLTAVFDGNNGMLKRLLSSSNNDNNIELDIQQQWGFYPSYGEGGQNSGAYVFRPKTPDQDLEIIQPAIDGARFVNTSVGIEVHVRFEKPWIRQVTRILTGQPYVEIEYTIGPIPIDDEHGKEVVNRFTSPIQSQSLFYTDSNGREFMKRQRNHRPTWDINLIEHVAGNYYPVNAAAFIQDDNNSFVVLVDRSQGGSSLQDGSLELMVHRRLLQDDGKGLSETLDETCGGMDAYPPYGSASRRGDGVVIRGVHRIMIGPGNSGASVARSVMDSVFAEPLVFAASSSLQQQQKPIVFAKPTFSILQNPLPSNVMMITLATITSTCDNTTFLLRLAHQYGTDENTELAQTVLLDLSKLLTGRTIVSAIELTLGGSQSWQQYLDRRLDWTASFDEESQDRSNDPAHLVIALDPMDIRTFEVVTVETASLMASTTLPPSTSATTSSRPESSGMSFSNTKPKPSQESNSIAGPLIAFMVAVLVGLLLVTRHVWRRIRYQRVLRDRLEFELQDMTTQEAELL